LINISQKPEKKTITAAHRDNNRNQMKYIQEGKPKNMSKHWRMPLPTTPLAATVMVVGAIPPTTTVGEG
jgi:hypothetical protein